VNLSLRGPNEEKKKWGTITESKKDPLGRPTRRVVNGANRPIGGVIRTIKQIDLRGREKEVLRGGGDHEKHQKIWVADVFCNKEPLNTNIASQRTRVRN